MKKKTVTVPLPKPSRVHERNPRRPLVDIFQLLRVLSDLFGIHKSLNSERKLESTRYWAKQRRC